MLVRLERSYERPASERERMAEPVAELGVLEAFLDLGALAVEVLEHGGVLLVVRDVADDEAVGVGGVEPPTRAPSGAAAPLVRDVASATLSRWLFRRQHAFLAVLLMASADANRGPFITSVEPVSPPVVPGRGRPHQSKECALPRRKRLGVWAGYPGLGAQTKIDVAGVPFSHVPS